MIQAKISKSSSRRAQAGLWILLPLVIFIVFPNTLSTLVSAEPVWGALHLFVFFLSMAAYALFDFSTKSTKLKTALKIAVVLGCLLTLYYACELIAERNLWYVALSKPVAFFYGLGIITSLALFFYALSSRISWGIRGAALVVLVYSLVNYTVLQFRGDPFLPLDIIAVGTALDIAGSYSFALTGHLWLALLMFVGTFFLTSSLKFAQVPKTKAWVLRAVALTICVTFFLVTTTKQFIADTDLEPFYWNPIESAQANSYLVNFVANISDLSASEPEGYSPETVATLASQYTSDSIQDAQEKPDVILLLGEGWADIVPEGYAQTDRAATPFISSFKERDDTEFKNLIVASAYGGTSKTEFQVLTGANAEYGFHSAPFQFNVGEAIPNIADSFKRLDYQTIAMHAGTASAWGRDAAFSLMGFDEFICKDELGEEDAYSLRGYVRDLRMYEEMLSLLDESDEPTFIYGITISSHGGYTDETYDATVHIRKPEGSYDQANQYLSLLRESDKDLKTFISALEQRDRPTLVLFFGDHIPHVEDDYLKQVVAPSDDTFWQYKTFFGVWANYDLPQTSLDDVPLLSVNYLGTYLMLKAGLPLTGYQKFLLDGAGEYPVTSVLGFMDTKGEVIDLEAAQETEIYRQQAFAQYNFVWDRKNMLEEFFYLTE